MASKSKKRSKAGSSNLVDQVKRHLQRGDFRQALKDARVAYRQDPSPECRCYLEHAYVGRAQQLAQNGLADDCRRVVRELLDLGVTEPSVQSAMPDLLLSVGMFDCLAESRGDLTEDARQRLRVKAADQAVIKPENTPRSMADLLDDARRIRSALEAVEREDDAAAMAHLKDIARQSLVADWKYFVRGLVAYYRHDRTEMLANWDRLDADRAAAKIAAPLKVLAGAAQVGDDGVLRAKVARLEKQATSRTVISEMGRLRQSVQEKDWPQVFKTLRAVRGELRSLDMGLYQRAVSYLCGTLIDEGFFHQLVRLSQIVDPLPLDPRWNRAKALACEIDRYDDELDPEEYWHKYLADLDHVSVLSPAERDLARALVWLRLAKFPAHEAWGLSHCRCGCDHRAEVEEAENEAREAFERSLTLAPAHEATYTAMADFHFRAGRQEEAAAVYRRMLRHLPDNVDALLFVAAHYIVCEDFLKACEFAGRARELKPLDPQIRDLRWTIHRGMARKLSLESQFDRAREEMAAADRLDPARAADHEMLASKAVLEIKAGDALTARRLVEQAQESLSEPAPLWLAMAIEANRYELPKEETWLYEKRWQDALKRRCRSETAGRMCGLLSDHLEKPNPYPQIQEHLRCLFKYVGRCKRVKWRVEDLLRVCELLERARSLTLLTEFARQGRRKFPEAAFFHFVLGGLELAKPRGQRDEEFARDCLQEAVDLASKSSDPRDKRIVELASPLLESLKCVLDDYYDEDDEDEDDEDDYDEDEDLGGEYTRGAFADEASTQGLSPRTLIEIIREACARTGMDPKVVFRELGLGKVAGQTGK